MRSTSRRFGYLWQSVNPDGPVAEYHYRQLCALLPEGHLKGIVLDAGCGLGIDSLHMAQDGASQVIGVELSEEGSALTARRCLEQSNISAVRGDLMALPIKDSQCDFIFSYGVLHHLTQPQQGFKELVRALKGGGWITVYVYEDFSAHTAFERAALSMVGGIRRLTIRLPESVLYRCCQLLAPLIFAFFTLPARWLSRWRWSRPLAARIPFRHGKELKGLTGDLFDRFAAPIEYRYNRKQIEEWFVQAGLTDVRLFWWRGWVASGFKAEDNA